MAIVTLTKVDDVGRHYTTSNGSFEVFKVYQGDSVGEVTARAGNGAARVAEFRALIGVPTEMIVMDQGNWDDGTPKPKKIKLPQTGGGNQQPKKDYVPRYRDTEEGFHAEQASIHRSVALKLAVKQFETAPDKESYERGVTELFGFYLELLGGGGTTSDPIPPEAPDPRMGKARAEERSEGGEPKVTDAGGVSSQQESSGDNPTGDTGSSPEDHKFSPWPPDGIEMLDGHMWCLTHGKAEVP